MARLFQTFEWIVAFAFVYNLRGQERVLVRFAAGTKLNRRELLASMFYRLRTSRDYVGEMTGTVSYFADMLQTGSVEWYECSVVGAASSQRGGSAKGAGSRFRRYLAESSHVRWVEWSLFISLNKCWQWNCKNYSYLAGQLMFDTNNNSWREGAVSWRKFHPQVG